MIRQLRSKQFKYRELSILKAIATSENLAKTEEAWLLARNAGAVIEEENNDNDDDDLEKEKNDNNVVKQV